MSSSVTDPTDVAVIERDGDPGLRSGALTEASQSRRAAASIERVVTTALVMVAAGIVVYRLAGWFTDDAYITFRFARNLAAGDGWSYNPGEHTANGATSPAYTVLIAVLSVPLRAATRASNVVFVASFGAIACLLSATFDRRRAPLVGVAAAVLLLGCPLVLATKGMESLAFLALVCAVLWAGTSGRDVAFGVCAALLVLVRAEGVLLCGLLFVQAWAMRRRLPWRALLAGGLVAAPWVAYSLVALGSVLPDTLSAKLAQRDSGFWGEGWIFLRGFKTLAPVLRYDTWLWVIVPLAVAGLVRGLADSRLRPVVAPLAGATVLHVIAYGLVLNVPFYHWYYSWEVFTLAVLAAVAVGWIIDRAIARLGTDRAGRRLVPACGLGLAVAALVVAGTVHVGPSNENTYYLENRRYVELGEWLAANTEPTSTVAATEIGVLGWYSERPIVDYLGLLDVTSADEVRRSDLVSWLERTEPDYWVVHEPLWPFEVPAAAQPWFHTAYQAVWTGQPNDAGYRMVVYERTLPIDTAKEQLEPAAPTP